MTTYVVRVWVPDRPGALGAVASRIGAVRGDLVGIDILERGGGRAIDELVVELPSDDLVPLLVAEMGQVDGVDVEDVRPAPGFGHDPRLDALETAAVLVEQASEEALFSVLVERAQADFEADWAVVVDLASAESVATAGPAPTPRWLEAFLEGAGSSAVLSTGNGGPDDMAWANLTPGRLSVVLGRLGRPLRARERHQLVALARIAESRRRELAARSGARL
ncbi:MAG TPA: hypothetical protein VM142_09570 [Acidimicrobiales bacterium]|nr:hypothetical protein [Acidimicrobiales bacterium]